MRETMHSAEHSRRGLRPPRRVARLVLLVLYLLVLTGLVSGISWVGGAVSPARADDGNSSQKIAVFEDARVEAGEEWDNVVVVGGDLVVEGRVKNVVVVVGGDVTVTGNGVVGADVGRGDTALVSVFGDVTVETGGTVSGETVDVAGISWDLPGGVLSASVLRTWEVDSILNWVWSTIFLAVVAVVAVAIAPRQVAVVAGRARRRFFSSLGWGALGAIVVVPIVTVLLIVTIIGILVVIPWLFLGLPLLSLFGLAAVGLMVGRLLLRGSGDSRGPLMLAAVVGIVIINLARWIPVAGVIILGILWLVGFGATYVSLWVWLRERRRQKGRPEQMVPPPSPQNSYGPSYGPAGSPPASPPYGQSSYGQPSRESSFRAPYEAPPS